jgi:hypothetical protein
MKNFPGAVEHLASITEMNDCYENPKQITLLNATFEPAKEVCQQDAVAAANKALRRALKSFYINNTTNTTSSAAVEEEEPTEFQKEYSRLRDEEWARALKERSKEEWDVYLVDVGVRADRLYNYFADIFKEPRTKTSRVPSARRSGRVRKSRKFYAEM